MGIDGKKLTDRSSKFGNKSLVNKSLSRKGRVLFSFEHFDHKTIFSFFGIGQGDYKWFISIFDRLKSIEKMDISLGQLLSTSYQHQGLRIHPIDWNAKKIPISREQLDWIPKDIINNEDEFPFYQMSISKGQGRIIGFSYEEIFYIVILDYNHNLQPSKKDNYQIQNTNKGISQYDDLLCKLEKCNCPCRNISVSKNIVYFYLEDEYYAKYSKNNEYSMQDIFEFGLSYIEANE